MSRKKEHIKTEGTTYRDAVIQSVKHDEKDIIVKLHFNRIDLKIIVPAFIKNDIALNVKIRDLHEFIVKIEIIKGWENFLISLMKTYHLEKMEKKIIDVYIGIKEYKGNVLVSLHYDIPYELIEFYGEEFFQVKTHYFFSNPHKSILYHFYK